MIHEIPGSLRMMSVWWVSRNVLCEMFMEGGVYDLEALKGMV